MTEPNQSRNLLGGARQQASNADAGAGRVGAAPPPAAASVVKVDADAGWYVDPTNHGLMRYWDGTQWTGDAMTSAPATPVPVTPLPTPPVPPAGPKVTAMPQRPAPPCLDEPSEPGAPAEPSEATTGRDEDPPEFSVRRGPHYVLGDFGSPGALAGAGGQPVLVTGEVPRGYDKVVIECSDGSVVDATIMQQRLLRECELFVGLVLQPVARVVATRQHGAQGIFLVPSLLTRPSHS
jgi:hypothetical protein